MLYGDNYLDVPFAPILMAFRRSGAPALMTVFRNDGRWDTSNAVFAGGQVVRYDKRARTPEMRYIDYGLGILTTKILEDRKSSAVFDLADVSWSYRRGTARGVEVTRRFYEIGAARPR